MNTNPPHPDLERLYWPVERMRDYQLAQLRETVARAARAPHYAPLLTGARVETLEDLARLPLTSKEDVRKASPFGLVAVPPEELFQYHESYGTTGTPASSWLTREDLRCHAQQINHAAVDFEPGDRVLVRFPFAISMPAHLVVQAARERGACVVPVSSRTAISPYTRVIELLGKLRATALACLPMEAIWLAETARQMGRDPARDFPHLRVIAVAGELLSNARRTRIAALWNTRVVNMYGCTEGGNIAADCHAGRLHLSWDHFLFEVLDEQTMTAVAPGQMGVAALTTLTRQASPLLRYQLGDYVRLVYDHNCPCGRTAPVLDHFGRDLNRFEFGGRWFFVRDLEERLLASPAQALGDLWLIDIRPNAVHFRAEAHRPDPALYRRLEGQIRAELGLPLVIDAVAPGALFNRARLTKIEPVRKPCVVGTAADGTPPLTLDDLM